MISLTFTFNQEESQKGLKTSFVLLLLLLYLPAQVQSQFITKGDAVKISEKCFKVTEDDYDRFGAVWWENKLDLRQSFELEFVIFLGSRDLEGADGIAFVMQNDSRGLDAKGTPGGGLGFGYHPTYTHDKSMIDVIKPSVAIEFDTYRNHDLQNEPTEDHTTIVFNGDLTKTVVPAVLIADSAPNVENDQCFTYKIKWNSTIQELQLLVNNNLRLSHKEDIVQTLFHGNPMVYYGFTGSTGGSRNEQTVCIYDVSSYPVAEKDEANTPYNEPVMIPVLENDYHTTQQAIGIRGITSGATHGTVKINGQDLEYSPKSGFSGVDHFTYEVCELSSDKCYSKCTTATVEVTVEDMIYISTAFSPNGDGLNDSWEIFKIEEYKKCTVEVYDRWGNTVFASTGYDTPWDGRRSGKQVPLGAYAYKIRFPDQQKVYTGYLMVTY